MRASDILSLRPSAGEVLIRRALHDRLLPVMQAGHAEPDLADIAALMPGFRIQKVYNDDGSAAHHVHDDKRLALVFRSVTKVLSCCLHAQHVASSATATVITEASIVHRNTGMDSLFVQIIGCCLDWRPELAITVAVLLHTS